MRTEPYKITLKWNVLDDGRRELNGTILDDNGNLTDITRHWLVDGKETTSVDEMRFREERFNMLDHIGKIEDVNAWIGERLNSVVRC